MKKLLFWILYIPIGILMVLSGMLTVLCEKFEDLAARYEDWTFGYSKAGWKHLGGGIYTKDLE